MAGLLVALSVMAILLSVALPAWSHMVRREKEEELVFRGNQYARAISLYQSKFANASPPTLDALIEQRLLRKKFKDPLSPNKDGEFQLLYLNNQGTSSRGAGAGAGSATGSTLGHHAVRRHPRRGKQEHRTLDPHSQRQDPLQRVAVRRSREFHPGRTRGGKWTAWRRSASARRHAAVAARRAAAAAPIPCRAEGLLTPGPLEPRHVAPAALAGWPCSRATGLTRLVRKTT